MRSILVHAADDGSFEARLQAGLDLARRFDAHLTVMQSVAHDIVIPIDPFGATAVDCSPQMLEQAEGFRDKVEGRLKQEDVRWDWHVESGFEGQALLRQVALNDLAIVGGTPSEGNGRRASSLAGTLAIHCRAPVLVMPASARGFPVDGSAALCWNGSIEAARAMRCAVPLMSGIETVQVLSVGDPRAESEDKLPALSAADYLERHDIDCEIVELPRGSEPIHETLFHAAQARRAGFMVMGAYGQPRIIETLFGGVTRSVLAAPPMPILMAH